MSNSILEGLVKEKDFYFKKHLFKVSLDHNLILEELLLLIYFLNQDAPSLDLKNIKEITSLKDNQIMESFTSLTVKGLISVNVVKKADGKINEVLDLSSVYRAMVSDINTDIKEKTKENIFSIFEKEFGRTLSPIEFEIINAWLKSGTNEELIVAALKEATFNGVSNLRYIDKILFEWNKKGFKKEEDVANHLKKKDDKESVVLFDYNWLDDE
ncbi:MAG: DnaD domain protein [Bacilli bacterium]|nr:DnaD domain protein [Bacilli bacterium]